MVCGTVSCDLSGGCKSVIWPANSYAQKKIKQNEVDGGGWEGSWGNIALIDKES